MRRLHMEDSQSSFVPLPSSTTGEASLLDQVDVAVYAVDADGNCVRLNKAAEHLLGFSQAEAVGQNMHQLVHANRADGSPYPVSECPFLHARSSKATLTDIAEVLWNKAGHALAVECSAAPWQMPDGTAGAVITIKDVRERDLAEERHKFLVREQTEALRQRDATARVERELAESESVRQKDFTLGLERAAADQLRKQQELLATVAETAPIGIAVLDQALEYRWQNHCYGSFLKAHVQDEEAARRRSGKPAVRNDEIDTILEQVSSTGETFSAEEFVLSGHDSSQTYWRLSVSRLGNHDLMIIAADITERVNTRREIETIYSNAPIALSLVDVKEFRYLRANREQANILGYEPEQVVGKTIDELVGIAEVRQLFESVAAGNEVRNQPVSGTLPSKPTELRQWSINLVPNFGKDGNVETISVAGSEITAQKKAEEALMQADKLAAVGRLAASISHEINNPLEAVTNLLYLVHQDPSLSTEASEYVRMAEGELARVSQIASQTLRFHRHAVGVVSLSPQQVVEPVVALYQGRLKNSHVKLQTDYEDDGPVVCMEGDVRQILNNLVGNAIDAIGDGGRIRIRTRRAHCAKTGRPGTRISVSDSGHGMKPETAAHIFEPFYTTKGAGGSGLGLWISHTLAERQGGVLQVRSCAEGPRRRGETGTTFSLFLPSMPLDVAAAR